MGEKKVIYVDFLDVILKEFKVLEDIVNFK